MNKKFLMVSHLLEYANPDIHKGDTILVGRWKNSPAEVKGFGKDKHNQPTVKTNKGSYSLYRFRIKKLMKESIGVNVYDFTQLWNQIKEVVIDPKDLEDVKDSQSRSSDRIFKRQIATINDISICLVNGKEVKQKIDMDFTEGSNGIAKKYVPENEVWLDSHYDAELLKPVLFHEMSERVLMKKYQMDYDTAHEKSNELEHSIISKS